MLKLKYDSKIIITEKLGDLPIICFIDKQRDVLNKVWYNSKKQNIRKERSRIIKLQLQFSEKIFNLLCVILKTTLT